VSELAYFVYTGRTSSHDNNNLAVEELGNSVIVAMYLRAREDILTGYIRDSGLKIMAVAHHDCVEWLTHEHVTLQVPDLDRPLPVPCGRLHQLYMMQQLECLCYNKLALLSSSFIYIYI